MRRIRPATGCPRGRRPRTVELVDDAARSAGLMRTTSVLHRELVQRATHEVGGRRLGRELAPMN